VEGHLTGEKNGKKYGMRLNIAAKNAEKIKAKKLLFENHENSGTNISTSIVCKQ
jgi:hypothetical protein